MTLLGMATANLRRRPLRVALSVVTIAISAAIVTLAVATTYQLGSLLRAMDVPQIYGHSFTGGTLAVSQVQQIQRLPALGGRVEWRRIVEAQGERGLTYMVEGVTADWFWPLPKQLLDIEPAVLDAWRKDKQGAIASGNLLERMRWKVGDLVTIKAFPKPFQLHIVGRATGLYTPALFMHFEYLDQIAPDRGHLTFFGADCPRERFDACKHEIEGLFDSFGTPALVMPTSAWFGRALSSMATIPKLMRVIAIIMGGLAVIVIGASLSSSLAERRAELGALRALGFTRGKVTRLVVGEWTVLATLGGLLGGGVPWALSLLGRLSLDDFTFREVVVHTWLVGAVTCAAALVSAVLAAFVARGALKFDVISVLEDRA